MAESSKPKEILDPRSIAIVYMTRYPDWYEGSVLSPVDTDKIRGDKAIETFSLASSMGYRVVVGDSIKSSPDFRRNLAAFKNIDLAPRESDDFILSVLSGLQTASQFTGVNAVITSQPEKYSIIRDCVPKLVHPIVFEGADVVVAKREEGLFRDTFPDYMYESEQKGNAILCRLLRNYGWLKPYQPDLDFFSGSWAYRNDPKLLREIIRIYDFKKAAGDEMTVRRHIGNHMFFYIFDALRLRKKVMSAEVPLAYSQEQRQNEEDPAKIEEFRRKRRGQRYAILEELIDYIRLYCEGVRRE